MVNLVPGKVDYFLKQTHNKSWNELLSLSYNNDIISIERVKERENRENVGSNRSIKSTSLFLDF